MRPAIRPLTLIMILMWSLAIAAVTGFAVVRLSAPEPEPTPEVEVLVRMPDGRQVPVSEARAAADGELPRLFPAAEFDLVDQTGQRFTSEQLEGKVWVSFIFLTRCPTGACPVMVGKMARLQEALPDEEVHFVSFTIDPENDTPELLATYAAEMGTGEVSDRWHLLTGGTRQEMHEIATRMKLGFDDQDRHSTWFLLVDAEGHVRGLYGNEEEGGMDRLAADARKLLRQQN